MTMAAAPNRILHPTDFSESGMLAFAHALRLALAMRARLYLLHIHNADGDESEWLHFPHVGEILGSWGLMDPNEPPDAVATRLGVQISKELLIDTHLRGGISRYAIERRCDLLVMGTHGRNGLRQFLEPSIAEDTSHLACLPTLFIPDTAVGFVDVANGTTKLDTLLIPVEPRLTSVAILREIEGIVRPVARQTRLELLHVGDRLPWIVDEAGAELDLPIDVRQGPVVETILRVAKEVGARLIAMPTEGRHGFLDALRGSTTERVLHQAHCPVLAVPAR